ncbi:hypothetical protein VULLAG_LOCUS9650 [Vulpes lagopus]
MRSPRLRARAGPRRKRRAPPAPLPGRAGPAIARRARHSGRGRPLIGPSGGGSAQRRSEEVGGGAAGGAGAVGAEVRAGPGGRRRSDEQAVGLCSLQNILIVLGSPIL